MQNDRSRTGPLSYLDFELEISPGSGREYPVTVVRSPAGEAHETMRFPFDELVLENRLKDLQIALLRSGGRRRRVPSLEEQTVQDFGQALFDVLLTGEVRGRYDVSLHAATQQGKGLRLKLRIQPPELAVLPWEFMYDSRQAEYICLSRSTPLVRYLELPQPIQPLTVTPPLHILGMIACPRDLPPLNIAQEKQRVEEALQDLQACNLVDLTWLAGQTWRDLQRAMRSGPWHVFHFIGHGGFDCNADEGFIALANKVGQTRRLSATQLGRLLADHGSLRLVLLNACEGARGGERDVFSSTSAILVRRGIPAVLAMQYEITDRAGIEFARAFYEALADRMPVDAAVAEARKAVSVSVANTVEWGTPVLYMRSSNGQLFDMVEVEATKQKRLEQLYAEAMQAGSDKDWAEAVNLFQQILEIDKNYKDASQRLTQAKKQERLERLYAKIEQVEAVANWTQVISLCQQILAIDKDYKDTSQKLAEAKKQEHLSQLYTRAEQAEGVPDWTRAISILQQILDIDKGYKDAPQRLTQAKKQELLDRLYAEVKRAEAVADWAQVIHLCQQIIAINEDYKDTPHKLAQAKEQERQERLDRLYAEAKRAEAIQDWAQVIYLCQQILDVDRGYKDASQKLAKAKRKQRCLLWKARLSSMGQRLWNFRTYHKNYVIATLILAVIAVGIWWFWPLLVPPVTPTPTIPSEQVVIEVDGAVINPSDDRRQEIVCSSSPRIQVTVQDSEGISLQPDVFSYNWRFDPSDPQNPDRLDAKSYAIIYSVPCERNNQTVTIEVLKDGKTLGVRRICFNIKKQP